MSIPLADLGSIKVPQHVHSYLFARAEVTGVPIVTQVAKLITEKVERELHVLSIANSKHKSKGFGEITSDVEG